MLILTGSGCGGPAPEKKPAREARPAAKPKVTQFYANATTIRKGEKALLCYGVENARAVRINPPVEGVSPALSRCVEITPAATTNYVIAAEGEDGSTATESFTVKVAGVAPPAPKGEAPAAGGPLIVKFATEKKQDAAGAITLLCYEAAGAEAVSLEPGVMPRNAALRGCLGVAPTQTTTYTLTAFGKGKRAERKLTLTVP